MIFIGRSKRDEENYRRFHYPGTDVLINKQDIRDAETLAQAERDLFEMRMRQPLPPEARALTYGGFKAIHGHLFQDVYDWAGRERPYTTGRARETMPWRLAARIMPTVPATLIPQPLAQRRAALSSRTAIAVSGSRKQCARTCSSRAPKRLFATVVSREVV